MAAMLLAEAVDGEDTVCAQAGAHEGRGWRGELNERDQIDLPPPKRDYASIGDIWPYNKFSVSSDTHAPCLACMCPPRRHRSFPHR